MKVEIYHTTTELKQLFRKEKNPRLSNRIRAVYLAMMGKSAPQIAQILGYGRRVIQNWIYSYNKKGLDGLQEGSGRGQQCKLNQDQLQWLRQKIEQGPQPQDGICVFHGRDIQQIIKQQFAISYKLNSVYKLLHKLGYSYVSSRPQHPKSEPVVREEFKKKSVIRSGKSVLIILERK